MTTRRKQKCLDEGKRHRLVLIDWRDAAHTGSWSRGHKEAETDRCQSVGSVLRDDNFTVVIAQSRSLGDIDVFADALAIPKPCILRVKILQV